MTNRHPNLGIIVGLLIFLTGLFFNIVARRMFSVCESNAMVNTCMPAGLFAGIGKLFMICGIIVFVFSLIVYLILRPAKKRYSGLDLYSTGNYDHCKACNAPIKQGSSYCNYCGSRQERQ